MSKYFLLNVIKTEDKGENTESNFYNNIDIYFSPQNKNQIKINGGSIRLGFRRINRMLSNYLSVESRQQSYMNVSQGRHCYHYPTDRCGPCDERRNSSWDQFLLSSFPPLSDPCSLHLVPFPKLIWLFYMCHNAFRPRSWL